MQSVDYADQVSPAHSVKRPSLSRWLRQLAAYRHRNLLRPRYPNVSFVPLPPDFHPVWAVHRLHLQDETAWPLPWTTLHVVCRKPRFFAGYRYISETECLFAILHKDFTRSPDFSIAEAIRRIEREISSGRLLKIIFQSPSARRMNEKWFTPAIDAVAETVLITPETFVERKSSHPLSPLKVLTVGNLIWEKGLFMLPGIVARTRRQRPDIEFTCVTSSRYSPLEGVKGLKPIVIWRMNPEQKARVFTEHHFLLNLPLGDTLASFLDCIKFNLPMITFPGQHGPDFVPEGTGYILPSPHYIYEPADFDRNYTLGSAGPRAFNQYVIRLHSENFFADTEAYIAEFLVKLGLGEEDYAALVQRQDEFRRNALQPSQWLERMTSVYRSL